MAENVKIKFTSGDEAKKKTTTGSTVEEKTLYALSDKLFDELDRLSNMDLDKEQLEIEINRAEAMTKVADKVISNAELVLRFQIVQQERFGDKKQMPRLLGR